MSTSSRRQSPFEFLITMANMWSIKKEIEILNLLLPTETKMEFKLMINMSLVSFLIWFKTMSNYDSYSFCHVLIFPFSH